MITHAMHKLKIQVHRRLSKNYIFLASHKNVNPQKFHVAINLQTIV